MIACVFFLFLSLYLSLYRVDLNQTSFRATVSSGWVTVNVRREGISQPRQARVTCREALGQGGGAAGAVLIAIPRFGWAFHHINRVTSNVIQATFCFDDFLFVERLLVTGSLTAVAPG